MRRYFAVLVFCGCCFGQSAVAPKFQPKLPDHVRVLTVPKPEAKAAIASEDVAQIRCAHIQVYKPPKDLDAKMIIGGGDKTPDQGMPVTPAMPVCPEDVHQLR